MAMVWGVVGGTGVYFVWWSFWVGGAGRFRGNRWSNRTRDALVTAGFAGVTPLGVVGASAAIAICAGILAAGISHTSAVGLVLGLLAGRGPLAFIQSRARRRRSVIREEWPEVVDNLASAIRAGLSLPEALGQIGENGPEHLRPAFASFSQDYRASGRFDDSLIMLKGRLADPVADRVVESLRVTRDVGGSDLGRVLRALSAFLREDACTRGELEARQSWVVNGARIAVAAPWLVLLLLCTRPQTAEAYGTPAGLTVIIGGALSTVVAYRLMTRIGRLPVEERVLR